MAAIQPSAPGAKAESFLQLVFGLLQELPGIVSDRVHLLTLELQRARRALAQMIALSVAAALMALTAWFVFWIGLTAAAVEAGLAWGWMLLIVLAVNAGAAWFAVARVMKLATLLTLPATVRRLTVAPAPARPQAVPARQPNVAPNVAPAPAPAAVRTASHEHRHP